MTRPATPFPRRIVVELATLAIVVAIALGVRTFVASIFVIPSDSMRPTLLTGDYLLVEKWPFGIGHDLPQRGDVVVFRAPAPRDRFFIKRVIGLPGDTIELHAGALRLNGHTLPRWRIADSVVPIAANSPCAVAPGARIAIEQEAGGPVCRTPRFREMLPGGRTLDTLDSGVTAGDDFGPATVPPHHLFFLGDNRDRSADSRFPPTDGQGLGMVPASDVVGRAGVVLLSVDGSARLRAPRTWLRAIRAGRIGEGF